MVIADEMDSQLATKPAQQLIEAASTEEAD
jgi:hypothetical protein